MANSFEAELEALVTRFARELCDEVTSLILGRLGIPREATRGVTRARAVEIPRPQRPAAPSKAKPAGVRRRARSTSEQRAASLDQIARVVSSSGGLSVSEIERSAGLPRAAVASALRALKDEGRVFMGGTKRFARYAATQAAADKASEAARGG